MVTYVINRNINFTNVCIKHCGFCAFCRDHREEEGYFLPMEEVVRRAREAYDLGAREMCVQAGLPPKMDGCYYVDLTKAIKRDMPDMHIHGFSPEEVLYGAVRARCSIEEYLRALKDAGVGSLPGTSAEILDQEVRDKISPGRITRDQWIEVVSTAHRARHPHDIDHHVRPRRVQPARGRAHRPAARHPEGHRRLYRVRAAELHRVRIADVQQAARRRRSAPGPRARR